MQRPGLKRNDPLDWKGECLQFQISHITRLEGRHSNLGCQNQTCSCFKPVFSVTHFSLISVSGSPTLSQFTHCQLGHPKKKQNLCCPRVPPRGSPAQAPPVCLPPVQPLCAQRLSAELIQMWHNTNSWRLSKHTIKASSWHPQHDTMPRATYSFYCQVKAPGRLRDAEEGPWATFQL